MKKKLRPGLNPACMIHHGSGKNTIQSSHADHAASVRKSFHGMPGFSEFVYIMKRGCYLLSMAPQMSICYASQLRN